jgi:hypothetical protein
MKGTSTFRGVRARAEYGNECHGGVANLINSLQKGKSTAILYVGIDLAKNEYCHRKHGCRCRPPQPGKATSNRPEQDANGRQGEKEQDSRARRLTQPAVACRLAGRVRRSMAYSFCQAHRLFPTK